MHPKIRFAAILASALVIGYNEAYTPPNKSSPSPRRRRFAPFIRKEDMTGVWKLTHPKLSFPTTFKVKEFGEKPKLKSSNDYDDSGDEIVLRLNDDGTFDQYATAESEDDDHSFPTYSLQGVLSRGGVWEFRDSNLILAPDRPQDATNLGTKVHDTLLAGPLKVDVSECMQTGLKPIAEPDEIVESVSSSNDDHETFSKPNTSENASSGGSDPPDIDVHLSIPSGSVKMGKFMYPRRHKAFFDDPMLFPDSSIGTFAMKQVLGNLNARLKREEQEEANKKPPKFDRSNFYDRRFYLTATPHAVNPSLAAQDKHYDEDKAILDVRVMPITFPLQ